MSLVSPFVASDVKYKDLPAHSRDQWLEIKLRVEVKIDIQKMSHSLSLSRHWSWAHGVRAYHCTLWRRPEIDSPTMFEVPGQHRRRRIGRQTMAVN